MANPWFRLYSEAVDDEKLRLLAFEDRWHFIALLCCKNNGLLDNTTDNSLMRRKVAVKLGLDIRELSEVGRRLAEVGLIDADTLQPSKWEKRQFISDNKIEGTNISGDYRGYIYFIGEKGGNTIKIGYSKNPWARVKDFQIGSPVKLSVIATVRTTEISEVHVHDLFKDQNIGGEWYRISDEISLIINKIQSKSILTCKDIINYVSTTRSNYVSTTTYTDTYSNSESESDSETHKSLCVSQPTPAGLCCRALKDAGIVKVNPSHPTLLALLQAGATEEEFIHAARSAIDRGKPDFPYVLGTVTRQREQAAKLKLHQGRMPNQQEIIEQRNRAVAAQWVPPEIREKKHAS
jgi:hypothetical protein